MRVPRLDGRAFEASLAGWVGTVAGDVLPGGGGGRVRCSWRVRGSAGSLGGLEGDGMDLFG